MELNILCHGFCFHRISIWFNSMGVIERELHQKKNSCYSIDRFTIFEVNFGGLFFLCMFPFIILMLSIQACSISMNTLDIRLIKPMKCSTYRLNDMCLLWVCVYMLLNACYEYILSSKNGKKIWLFRNSNSHEMFVCASRQTDYTSIRFHCVREKIVRVCVFVWGGDFFNTIWCCYRGTRNYHRI